jgi:DNA-binding MarR family transcriptional regulator
MEDWRHANIGRLLNNAVRRFEQRVFQLLEEAGHREARLPHLNLTRNLNVEGTRITELARRAEMTKQAMGELVGEGEKLGIVVSRSDPSDRRAKLVTFTDKGMQWLDAFHKALERAEVEMRQELGRPTFARLSAALHRYGSRFDSLGNMNQPAPSQRARRPAAKTARSRPRQAKRKSGSQHR